LGKARLGIKTIDFVRRREAMDRDKVGISIDPPGSVNNGEDELIRPADLCHFLDFPPGMGKDAAAAVEALDPDDDRRLVQSVRRRD
jgi:hypothetical protein